MANCVFCGKKAVNKNKEHVIPRWLIAMTGDPGRNAFLGLDFAGFPSATLGRREYSFDRFAFPACTVCNDTYSEMESLVKPIVEDILNDKNVSILQVNLLLDWFDKVRVGLWLGYRMLDKNWMEIDPSFHIDQRIGQFDRALFIRKTDGSKKRLNFSAASPMFMHMPSVFSLVINNFHFLNLSTGFMLGRRLGFPYPASLNLSPDSEQLGFVLLQSRERVMRPVMPGPHRAGNIQIYQANFRRNGLLPAEAYGPYENNYVKEHSLDFERGMGSMFLVEDGKNGDWVSNSGLVNFSKGKVAPDKEQFLLAALEAINWQEWVLNDQNLQMNELRPEQRTFVKARWKTAFLWNKLMRSHVEAVLKKMRQDVPLKKVFESAPSR